MKLSTQATEIKTRQKIAEQKDKENKINADIDNLSRHFRRKREITTSTAREDIGYYPAQLTSAATFPARTPPDRHYIKPEKGPRRYWTRTNGKYTLTIEAGSAFCFKRSGREKFSLAKDCKGRPIREQLHVPSGIIPRHIMLYLCRQWKRNKSRTIPLGGSLNEFLQNVYIPRGGESYRRIREQIRRFVHCRIGFIVTNGSTNKIREHFPKPIIEKQELWWNDNNPDQMSCLPSSITISETLEAILDIGAPLNIKTVTQIGGNVLAYDLYAWLTWRLYSIYRPVTVKYKDLHEQFGSHYSKIGAFKRQLRVAWDLVRQHYRHNSVLTAHGIELRKSKTDIVPINLI